MPFEMHILLQRERKRQGEIIQDLIGLEIVFDSGSMETSVLVYSHTTLNVPDLVSPQKLSRDGRG